MALNTRPYISFDFRQCARFTHNTKESHETTVKRICQYLQITKDNGLLFKPFKKLVVDYYADIDFAGLWGHENAQDLICAGSITGFVLIFPIVLYSGYQNYRHILFFIHYILSSRHSLIMLEYNFP